MDSPRRTVFQTPKPQDGFSEWSSKIKELQRLVDADEEKEQRKLEDEIAASRLARLRRGRAAGSRTNSVDAADDPDLRERLAKLGDGLPTKEDAPPTTDRRQQQDSALSKPSGLPPASSSTDTSKPVYTHPAAIAKRVEPMSLAAFMGGSATGPRLRKHAPQQDASDPTQFEQRTQITSPHPIFGSGGIALPGLIAKSRTSPAPDLTSAPTSSATAPGNRLASPGPIEVPARSATRSVSPVPPTRNLIRRTPSPQKSTPSLKVSQIPIKASPIQAKETAPSPVSREPPSWKDEYTKKSSAIPIPSSQSTSPIRTTPSPRPATFTGSTTFSPASPGKISSAYPFSKPRENAPPSFLPRQPTSSSSSTSPIHVSYLAGPIKPEPRLPPDAPKIPPSQKLSRAFLKNTPPKDPTPSISRLKGRGFVQSMIQASSELEIASMPSIRSPPPGERPSPSGKKVLDRWQPTSAPSNIPPPIIAPKPLAPRRSTGSSEEFLNKPASERKKRASLPAPEAKQEEVLEAKMPPEGTPGLGSGSTLISYMKAPEKTSPRAASPSKIPSPRGSRSPLGAQQASQVPSERLAAKEPVTSGLLSHPTKFRAKRARKTATNTPTTSSNTTIGRPEQQSIKLVPTHSLPSSMPVPAQREESTESNEPPRPMTTAARIAQLTRDQTKQPILGMNIYTSTPSSPKTEQAPTAMKDHPAYRALPGLAKSEDKPRKRVEPEVSEPEARQIKTNKPSPNLGVQEERPQTPSRHTRIPSTGNRPTIMDVAQILNENADKLTDQPTSPSLPVAPAPSLPSSAPPLKVETEIEVATTRPRSTPSPSAEKRKSSYEKYSSFMMPPLLEEKTPVASPAGTLSRSTGELPRASTNQALDMAMSVSEDKPISPMPSSAPDDDLLHFDIRVNALPSLNIPALLNTKTVPHKFNVTDTEVISLEVSSIASHTVTPINDEYDIFYENEVLAIIQRARSRSAGLVKTTVWGWQGKHSNLGDQEAQKLQEISKRYGTPLLLVEQYEARVDLAHALGGNIIIRQGHRSLWSADNTSMHAVQNEGEVLVVEERELSKSNLCSGFSFCITFLDTVYVWHGRGSLPSERVLSLEYGNRIAAGRTLLEISEGDEPDIFWMMFGEEDYACADYWRFKLTTESKPRAWRIDAQSGKNAAYPLVTFSEDTYSPAGVFLLDCIWEFYVLVGEDARDARRDISLALQVGQQMCDHQAQARPYKPNLHVVVLPSLIPVDLPMHFRQIHQGFLRPDASIHHVHVLSAGEATEQLNTTSWKRSALKDLAMLPLGVSPAQIGNSPS